MQRSLLSAALLLIATMATAGTSELTVNGLVCGFCAQGIEKALRKNPATADVIVSLDKRLVAVATKPGWTSTTKLYARPCKLRADVKGISRTDRSLSTLRDIVSSEP